MLESPSKKIPDPDPDADDLQNLISFFFFFYFCGKICVKIRLVALRSVANRQTGKRCVIHNLLVEVIIRCDSAVTPGPD